MLDRVVNFFTRIFQAVGHGLGRAVSFVLSPFRWFTGWYGRRGGILKVVLGALLLVLVALYLHFFCSTQRWTNFDPNYAARYTTPAEPVATGDRPAGGIVSTTEEAGAQAAQTCRRSQIVDATADLVDFNVNQVPWISSMLLYKLGLFGIPWERTPFFDNKTAFQRGVNQAVRRTAIELVDTLGRVRGTSGIDPDLQKARGNLQFYEETWYFAFSPFFGPNIEGPGGRPPPRAATSFSSSSTASPTISARPPRFCATDPRNITAAGSIPAPTTASGSPTANSTAITAFSPRRTPIFAM